MLDTLFGLFSADESDAIDESAVADEPRIVDESRRGMLRKTASAGAALGMVGTMASGVSAQSGDGSLDCTNYQMTCPSDDQTELPEIDQGNQLMPAPDEEDLCNTGSRDVCDGVTCCPGDCADWCDECVPRISNRNRVTMTPFTWYTNVCLCECA